MKKSLSMGLFVVLLLSIFSFPSVQSETQAKLTNSTFHFPKQLRVIEREAFSGTGAVEVVLPDGFSWLDSNAFAYANNLSYVHIPSSTEFISNTAFLGTSLYLIIGQMESYAQVWAKEHDIPFVSERIWRFLMKNHKLSQFAEGRPKLPIAEVLKDMEKMGLHDTDLDNVSRRPQDRPELHPIDYRFP